MNQNQSRTVYELFAAAAGRWPDRPFLNVLPETASAYGIEAGERTYRVMLDAVDMIRDQYAAAGYTAGARVMLLLENRPSYFLHWFALNALGLSVVPVNPDLQSAELAYMAGHAEPVLAIATPERVADLEAASRASGIGFPVISGDMELPEMRANAMDEHEPSPDHEAAMLYTSGTTGNPKGCVLSNSYFLHAGRWYASAGGVCALGEDGERMITPLPMFHMNAMACSLMAMITVGGCLIVLDRFHPKSWWRSVRDSHATCLHYLGVMPSILMKAEASQHDRDHSVRFGFGAGIDPKLHVPFEERFGIPLVEAWAMTETGAGAVIAANREPRRRGESCLGRPEAEVETRIVLDDGSEARAGEPGELLVRRAGPDPRYGFFSEYYKDAKATAEAWEGGWFHTGDIVMRDDQGDFFFVDRKKNVIRRSGENIAAVEVETVLMQHPEIRAVAAAAAPDALRGDEVLALIVTDGPRSDEAARAIVAWALERMAYYKVPGHVAFVDELPLTPTQKIQRGALKKLVPALLEDPATVDTRAMKKRLVPS
ncbi:AMP-binding protein [Nitratireductor sp. XY-223]|uniref:AMP-binding protein n=1 Tax=Nitratireductor sp. XY-223 TaxID=2561926 RepID=UPI0010AAABEE|nr:AMP-binding protein [Nitratireductor sp. XY-223]